MKKHFLVWLVLSLVCQIPVSGQEETSSGEIAAQPATPVAEISFSPSPTGFQYSGKSSLLTTSFHQEIDYAKRARTQTIFAWTLVAAGTGLLIAGIVQAGKEREDIIDELLVRPARVIGFVSSGLIVGGCSIPLFIAAKKNRTKASATASVMLQSPVVTNGAGLHRVKQPAIGLQWWF